jgi:hypothetical protein
VGIGEISGMSDKDINHLYVLCRSPINNIYNNIYDRRVIYPQSEGKADLQRFYCMPNWMAFSFLQFCKLRLPISVLSGLKQGLKASYSSISAIGTVQKSAKVY